MKKILFHIFALSVAALTFASCAKELESPELAPESQIETRTVSFIAESIEAKTVFGEKDAQTNKYPTLWTENQTVGVSMNFASAKESTKPELSAGGATAKFDAELEAGEATSFKFYAVSPYASVISMSSSYKSVQVDIPASQTPLDGSVDEKAQILVSESTEYGTFPESVSLVDFAHITAYGKIGFSNLSLAQCEVVESVSLTAAENWAGRYYYYLESNGSNEKGDLVANSAGKTITLATSKTSDIWFACAPVDLGGKTIDVVITTDKGTTYSKTITIPAGKVFASGTVKAFTINMDGVTADAAVDYVLVKNVDDLTVGSEVIIAAYGDIDYAISTTQNTNNRAATVQAKSDDDETISSPGAAVQILTIEAGNVDNTIAFNTGDGYLYAASSGSNYLRTETDLSDNSSWQVTIDSATGEATVVAQGANARNDMRYNPNNGNPIFSCYASTSTNARVAFYKKPDDTRTRLDAPTAVQADSDDTSIMLSWIDIIPPLGVTVTYKVTCTGQTDQIVDNGNQFALFDNLDTGLYDLTITAIPSDTQNYRESTPVVVSDVRVGKVALATPVIKSFAQTKTGIVAELEAPIDNAFNYEWTLREEGMNDDAGFFVTQGVSLESNFGDTEQIWTISSFTVGKEYTIFVKAVPAASSAEYKASEASATASFTAKDLDNVTYYTKVTSEPSDWSGTYLIVYEDGNVAMDGSLTALDAVSNTIAVAISGNQIESTATTDASNFVIASMTDGYSIKAASGKYIGRTATSNGLNSSDTEIANTISMTEGQVEVTSNIGSTTPMYLRFNTTSGQTRFRYFNNQNQKAIALYKLDGSTAPVDNRTDVTMSFDPAGPFEMNLGDQIDPDMTSLMLEPDNAPVEFTMVTVPDGIATIDSDSGEILTITGAGTITVTATVTDLDNYKPASASYVLVVKEVSTVNVGTAENPLTASQAIALAEANPSESFENAYVKGIVCQTGTINSSGQVNYYVSDDGSTTGKFEMYKGKYINGESFTADTNLGLGDVVVATGTLKYYSSGSQAELDTNNEVVSVFRAPKFSPAGGIYTEAQTVTLSAEIGATIYYTLDESVPTANSPVYSTPLSISANTTIKAIAVKGNESTGVASATYTIDANSNDGSLQKPYTADEAYDLIVAGSAPSDSKYVSDKVVSKSASPSSGKLTYFISSDGTATKQIQVYKGKFINNTDFTSADQIQAGDDVVVYGPLVYYNNSTAEINDGNYIYSLNGFTKALTAGTLSTEVNDNSKQITVTWGAASGSDNAISYVVKCDTQTYNATAAGSHVFTMSDYGTYNVSVVASASDAAPAVATTVATLTNPNTGTNYATTYTSNVTMTAGTNGSSVKVKINNVEYDGIKVGTSKAGGDMSVKVPSGTTKLHVHAAAWKGVSGLSLNISGATVSPTSISLKADDGISNNSPFTFSGTPSTSDYYFEITLSNITAETTIKFETSTTKRFVIWGVNAE